MGMIMELNKLHELQTIWLIEFVDCSAISNRTSSSSSIFTELISGIHLKYVLNVICTVPCPSSLLTCGRGCPFISRNVA